MTQLASLTAIGNGLSPNDGSGDGLRNGAVAINNAWTAIAAAVNALAAAQSAGGVSYPTKAAMNADLSKADGTIALVWNDSTASNNQTWIKVGASGTGSWSAATDRLAQILGNGAGFQQSGTGAVVRPFQDKAREWMSVIDKGADPTGVADSTAAFQRAINESTYVIVPEGSYNLRKITWRTGVTMQAIGSVFLNDIVGDTSDCMLSFGQSGFIQQWSLIGQFRIVGCGNTTSGGARNGKGKIGILLDSTPDGTGQGGNWYFYMKGVRVSGFSGPQIWERGGDVGTASQVNQFGVYSNVLCLSQTSVAGSYAFLASGKNGQRSFDAGCLFQQNNTDIAFRICRYMDASGALTGADGHAYNFVATGASFQQGSPCISVERGQMCVFEGVYLELGLSGALFTTSSEQCYFQGILNNTHANAGAGYGIRVGSVGSINTQALTIGNVEINGAGDIGVDGGSAGAGAAGGICFYGTVSLDPVQTTTPFKNCSGQPSVASNAVNLSGRNTAIVGGPNTITTITSNASPGQMVTLKAHNGALTFAKGGNITLPYARTTVTIPKDASATFIRMDLAPNGYLMVGAIDPSWA
jgi:hypothetical protein